MDDIGYVSQCFIFNKIFPIFLCPTANNDYSPVNEDVVINPGEQSECIEIPIVNDDILESDETFSILLTSNQIGVNVDVSETTVTIMDNDSKLQ